MYQLTKKIKRPIIPKHFMVLLLIFVLIGIVSCTENSDKLVSESLDAEYFSIDQITDKNFDYNTSNLIEKVVVLEGEIEDINYLNNRSTIILKGKQLNGRLVICDMQSNQSIKLKNLNIGETINVKGIFKGSLSDLILQNCIIPQPKINE